MRAEETKILPHSQFLSLVYHDLFGYPLTAQELWFWQIGGAKEPRHLVFSSRGFYCLQGRKKLIFQRMARTQTSLEKFKIAHRAAKLLRLLPTVRMIGVTGSLSMGNAGQDSDIDLLIVTVAGTLWITRLLAFAFLKFSAQVKLRRFGDTRVQDKLCLNLWLDENNMGFSQRADIYTAHEILQVKILLDRGNTYQKFLKTNLWVREVFPNGFRNRIKCIVHSAQERRITRVIAALLGGIMAFLFRLLDRPAYFLQMFYMRGKITREKVEKGKALFHPLSWQEDISQLFLSRLENLKKSKSSPFFVFPSVTD